MVTAFWDNTDMILVELLDRGDTVPAGYYSVRPESLRQVNRLS
jgi:hypothetical protein